MGKATLRGFIPEFGVENIESHLGIDSLPLKKKFVVAKNKVNRFRNMDVLVESGDDGDPQAALERMEERGVFNVRESFFVPTILPVSVPKAQILLDDQPEESLREFNEHPLTILGEEVQNFFDRNVPVYPSKSRSMLRYLHKNYKKIQKRIAASKKKKFIQIMRRPARREALLEETGMLFS